MWWSKRAAIALVAAFAATRVLTIVTAAIAEAALTVGRVPPAFDDRPILSSLTGFDAVYYLGIAAEGYHLEPIRDGFRDWAFFPGFPIVTRLVSVLTGGDLAIAGVLVANFSLLLAMFVLFAIASRYLDEDVALRSVVYLVVAPGAVAFGLAYSDSLFLLLAAGSFLAAERRSLAVMAVLVAAASITRLPGVLLTVPLAVLLWQSAPRGRDLLWLAAGPLALAGFMLYQADALGYPLAFLAAQSAWDYVPPPSAPGVLPAVLDPIAPLLTSVLVGHVFLLVYVRADHLPRPYAVFAVVSLITALGSLRLLSLPRYLAVVWPFSWLLANRRSSIVHVVWPCLSTGLFVIFAVLHFTETMAP